MRIRFMYGFTILALPLSIFGCDVDKTEEGEAPEIDVESGELPEYDVDTPDVEIERETRTIETPTLDVTPADEVDEAEGETNQ